ncbi:acetyl-CoA carboxylase biotin carboxyl carrier protein subunit [Streptomyces sp. TLI_171]|uniref:acetyl-CoA carboxylase biotin carboxyl carrier protein subunit n=1 Tax=Streptomyces sp. TLI_171 TaxID=1938859 RepID=UPI000C184FFB|nr:acetyl-CoA carboxylase biotin carboxyl carrier protein subunit [Streptomyces sp. TLI_171]RKE20744.1 biotin-dependent enzyme [Streptomyces sp. TLI_171]
MSTVIEPETAASSGPSAKEQSQAAVAAARAAAVLEPGLDQPVRLVGARLWLAGAALLLAVGAGGGWAVWGRLPHTLTVHAVAAHGEAPVRVAAERAGSLVEFKVRPGEKVTAGQVLALVGDAEATAPTAGTVTALLAAPGAQLNLGSPLLTLDPAGAPATVRLLVDDPKDAARLKPALPVLVPAPGGGAIHAVVERVEPLPVRADSLDGALPVAVPGLPSGAAPVWVAYARLPQGVALNGPLALDVRVDLGSRHPYQAVLGQEAKR